MERGPLPPHERTWRHPSELAAEERAIALTETSARGTRLLALATGGVGLLAVGLLMITVTPRRAESPIAISASTTPIVAQAAGPRPIALAPSASGRRAEQAAAPSALATPIGDGRFALITRASLVDARRSLVSVRLPSGRTSAGEIVTASADAVVVALATSEPGHAIAERRPRDGDMVTVMAIPPIVVAYEDVDTLAVAEGTAVLDTDGHLVGICSRRRGSDHVRLIEVIAELAAATSVVP